MAKLWIVEEFKKRLQAAERSGDCKELVALFASNAELENLTRTTAATKSANAGSPSQFWSHYLRAFDSVSSRFTGVTDDGSKAVLEWHSSGQLPMGLPVEYNGVSILEYEGEGDLMKIKKFRTYYDSAALLPHAPHVENSHSQTAGGPNIDAGASS